MKLFLVEVTIQSLINFKDRLVPYLVFFPVRILSLMNDSNEQVRLSASLCFSKMLNLLPLQENSDYLLPLDTSSTLVEIRNLEKEFLSQLLMKKIEPFNIPIKIRAELRSYQQEGVNWLAFLNKFHLHGILCDDMGLGKTLQTICIVASEWSKMKKNGNVLPTLVVAPSSVTGHWMNEFVTYSDLRPKLYSGHDRKKCIFLN